MRPEDPGHGWVSSPMEDAGMHKDVKRSLLIWPAIASATISATAWFAQSGVTVDQAFVQASTDFPKIELDDRRVSVDFAVPMCARGGGHSVSSLSTSAEATPRIDQGTRAMQLPNRVARVYGVQESEIVVAPVRDPQQEMAGWVEPDFVPGQFTRKEFVTRDPDVDELNPNARLSRSQPNFLASVGIDGLELTPASILPTSTRVLAKPASTRTADRVIPVAKSETDTAENPNALAPATNAVEAIESLDVSDKGESPEAPADGTEVFPSLSELEFSPTVEPLSPGDMQLPSGLVPNAELPDSTVPKKDVGRTPKSQQAKKIRVISPPESHATFAGWPQTVALDDQLSRLMNGTPSEIQQWAADVAESLSQLQAMTRLADSEAGVLIDRLHRLALAAQSRAEALKNRQHRVSWLLASHALERRTRVWKLIWRLGQPRWMVTDEVIEVAPPVLANDPLTLTATLGKLKRDIAVTGDTDAWSKFLLLEEIESASREASSRDRTILAQRLLSRLEWHGLDDEQSRWLKRASVKNLANVVRPWARGAVDYANLLRQIERQEADAIDLGAIDIANSVQSLRFADTPDVKAIGDQINTHYRNANIRLAISDAMIQRLLPAIEPQTVPVRATILGSRVRGQSQIKSDLMVQLTPAADRWKLDLKAIGNVRTNSSGFNSGVVVKTLGNAKFNSRTPIEIDLQGIESHDSDVRVQGATRLRGVRSDYDGFPVVGSLVRRIATNRFESVRSQANRISNGQIRMQVQEEIDDRVDEQIDQATQRVTEMVLGPLGSLALNPKVMDLQTTQDRLLARYRLAGDWQLAAFTPRPRAPSSSLMSLQIHQSTFNNLLEQLIPRDRPLSIQELVRHSAETFGQQELDLPEDIPSDVMVQFAKTRPITVEVKDDRLSVTLRVQRLQRGERPALTRFIVRAQYMPQMDGMQAQLVRDGHLRISGPGMSARERLPLRAIFNKVLSPNRAITLTVPKVAKHPAMADLAISQLELRDGWIAMAVSESESPRLVRGKWVLSPR